MPAAQDALPTMDALLAAMTGANSTSDWDVLVSYSVTRLNAILPSLWKGDTFDELSFNRDYLDFERRTTAHLSIGAPTLQFVAGENAKALLTMALQGWLRTDTLVVNQDTGEIISVTEGADNTKVTIAPGRYQLQAAVPLVNMTGDAPDSIQEAGQRVVLGDKTPGSKIVFHFKSHDAVYNVTLAPGITDKRKEDTHMSDLAPRITMFFQDLNSLDYAIAGVQQPKNATDLDRVLTPESFIFTTQGSSPGVLCVYIKTRGSGNDAGWAAPHFQPNNNDVLPIPQGATASIIIRHELFNEKYLIPQLTQQVAPGKLLGQVNKDNGFVNGFRYLLQMNASCLKNDRFGSGPWHNWDLNIDYAFTDPPLALALSNRSANWYWQFKDYRYDWSHWKSGTSGKVYFDVGLNANYPIASVTEEKLALKVDLRKEDFNLWVHPYHGTLLEKMRAGWSDSLPDVLQEHCYFDINDLRLGNEDFNFFATENVFAPGQHIIKLDSAQGVAAPHDIIMVGDVVPPVVLAPPPGLLASADSADGDADGAVLDGALGAGVSPSVARLKTLLFTDQAFVTKAFSALRDGKTQDFEKAVNDKQLTVSDSDVQTLRAEASMSPAFDIRLAAGVYKISSPPSMVAVSMTISPLDGMISFDNVHVENQTTDTTTGFVSWTTGQGANMFQAGWTTDFNADGSVKSVTFQGQTWPASQPANKTPFTGSKITPDTPGGSWFGSATSQGVTFVLSVLGMTALVLAGTILSVQEFRRRNQDPAPAVAAAQPQADAASAAVQSEVEASLRADPLDVRPEVVSSIRQQAVSASRASAAAAAAAAAAGSDESAATVERVADAVKTTTLRNAARETLTRLGERFRPLTIKIMRGAGHVVVAAESAALAHLAAADEWAHRVAERAVHSATALREAQHATADLASAVREVEGKRGEATRLRGEKQAKEQELERLRQAGDDPAKEEDAQKEIQRLEGEIERAEREVEEADARRAESESRAEEEREAAEKAEEELKDVEVIDLPEH